MQPLAVAADWPQWRGPASQGISTETGLPTQWSADKNIAWKATLGGTGTSSPIVIGDTIFVTSQLGSYSRANGSDPRLARDDRSLSARENSMGAAKSDEDVAEFLKRLKLSAFFSEVYWQQTQPTVDAKLNVAYVTFDVTCKVNY